MLPLRDAELGLQEQLLAWKAGRQPGCSPEAQAVPPGAPERWCPLFGASPRWIISARLGCAKTLATRNTMSAFLGLTRSVRSARLRKPRKSLV